MFARSPQTDRPAPPKRPLDAIWAVPPGAGSPRPGFQLPPSPPTMPQAAVPLALQPWPEPHDPAAAAAPAASASGFTLGSIIGNDLTIVGQGLRIITRGLLRVDGKVDGDVVGAEVVVGERGCVNGVVSAENVAVRGRVNGTIKGVSVTLHASAHVEGDVHHRQLAIEEGAHLDGRVTRPSDPSELVPDFGRT